MPTPSAVLFDYGLVLSGPPDPASWEALKHVIDAPESSFHEAYWKYRHDYDRGTLTAEAYWRQIASDHEKTLTDSQVADFIAHDTEMWTQPNQPMIDWAAALQRAGIKTGILSNIGDEMEFAIRARCLWLQDFTHQTFSHSLKIAKPEQAIYLHAAKGLGVPPSEVLFIDDREENIVAAHAAGMNAIRYTHHADFLHDMADQGFGTLLNP